MLLHSFHGGSLTLHNNYEGKKKNQHIIECTKNVNVPTCGELSMNSINSYLLNNFFLFSDVIDDLNWPEMQS